MLILTRNIGESITIGDDIQVSVLGIRGRQVRIGIAAPNKVKVYREEIYIKIQDQKGHPAPQHKSSFLPAFFRRKKD